MICIKTAVVFVTRNAPLVPHLLDRIEQDRIGFNHATNHAASL